MKRVMIVLTGAVLLLLAGVVGAVNTFSINILPNPVWEGSTKSFTLTVTNNGNLYAINQVNLTLNNFTNIVVTGPGSWSSAVNGNTITWSGGSIPDSGGSGLFFFNAKATLLSSDINDTWSITTQNTNNEINSTIFNVTILKDNQPPVLGAYAPLNYTKIVGSAAELFYQIVTENESGVGGGMLLSCLPMTTSTPTTCGTPSARALSVSGSNLSTTINLAAEVDGEWFNFYFNVSDIANNTNASADWYHVQIDRPPTLTLVAPTPSSGNITNQNWVFVNATSNYNLSSAILQWTNSSGTYNISMSNSSPINWFVNMSGLSDYVYVYNVLGNKTTGVMNASESRNVTIDTTAPSAPNLFSPSNGTFTNDNTPTLVWNSSSDSSGINRYRYQVANNSAFSSPVKDSYTSNGQQLNYTPMSSAPLSEGLFYWRIRAQDNAMNWGNWSDAWEFTVDNTTPSVTLNSPATGTWLNVPTVVFNFTFTDTLSPTANCSLYVDATLKNSSSATANNSATTLSASSLAEGARSWYINCTDLAGNTRQSATTTLNIDITPPQIAFILPTPASGTSQSAKTFTINVSHNDTNPANVSVYLNSALAYASTYNGTNGYTNWTSTTLADGSYNYYVCTNDSASNQNCTETRTLTIYTPSPPGGSGYSGSAWTATCQENWTCSDWTAECVDSQYTRVCIDQSNCGTKVNRPADSISCTPKTTTISVTQVCSPGAVDCRDGNVAKCNSAGIAWDVQEICTNGCSGSACLAKKETASSGGLTGLFLDRTAILNGALAAVVVLIAGGLLHLRARRKWRYNYNNKMGPNAPKERVIE